MTQAEIERLISLIQVPSGDDATLRIRDDYTDQLVNSGHDAQESVITRIESGNATNMPVLMTLLAAFGNERAAAVLSRQLEAGSEPVSGIAATALAAYASPFARRALERGAASDNPQAARAAAAALRALDVGS